MSITNKWEEQEDIGKGSCAKVYRVRSHGKDYALKKINHNLMKDPIHRQNVEREIKIMESLDHPKIIKLYRTIFQDQQICLLMEYASGGSLFDQLKIYGKLSEKQVKKYVCDITEGLQYLHNRPCPIIHRDIKPQNLLMDGEGNCKLADFGSSNILDGVRNSYVGTPLYMPPEIVLNKTHGTQADLWNLGMLIYQLLTGIAPKVQEQKLVYPSFISRPAQDVMKKLLVAEPEKRMSINELRQHIWLSEAIQLHSTHKEDKMVSKIDILRQTVNGKLIPPKIRSPQIKQSSPALLKQKSTISEQNQQVAKQASYYIDLLKEKEKLKHQIMINQKRIEKQQNRRLLQKPFLLEQIDRMKCQIKEYQKNIAILRVRPLKMQAQCRKSIELLQRKIQELTEYIRNLPKKAEAELLHFSDYQPPVQKLPISEYIFRLKINLMSSRRNGLIELVTAKKTHADVKQMTDMQQQISGIKYSQQKNEQIETTNAK